MVSVKPSLRQLSAHLRCVRPTTNSNGALNGSTSRLFSHSTSTREEVVLTTAATPSTPPPPSPPTSQNPAPLDGKPEYMQKWGKLDPTMVANKRDERRLMRRDGVQPIGSRRRRATLRRSALRNTPEIPFEQLPYQCFQEARKILLGDRQEKLKQIEETKGKINRLLGENGGSKDITKTASGRLLRSYQNRLKELVILADINDPVVKKTFEDGQGDMNKPIYRYLADQKWRKYKRLILEQRISQFALVPDLLPAFDPIADVDLAFGRKSFGPGDFVDSAISVGMPRLNVQSFESGEKLVSVVVVDCDVPVPERDSFTYRCHFAAANIKISPTETSIPFNRIEQEDAKVEDISQKRIGLPWLAPTSQKGAPYRRLAVFVLEQLGEKPVDLQTVSKVGRDGFALRSYIDKFNLKPIGATLFRTQWDENMTLVMQSTGRSNEANVEFKRKKVEPLPYKRRTERMR